VKVLTTICSLLCLVALLGAGKGPAQQSTMDVRPAMRASRVTPMAPWTGVSPGRHKYTPPPPGTDDSLWINTGTIPGDGNCNGLKVYGNRIWQVYYNGTLEVVRIRDRLTGALIRDIAFPSGGTYAMGLTRFGANNESLAVSFFSPSDIIYIGDTLGSWNRSIAAPTGYNCRGMDWDGSKFWLWDNTPYPAAPRIYTLSKTGTLLRTLTYSSGFQAPEWGMDLTLDLEPGYGGHIWATDDDVNSNVKYIYFDTLVANTYSVRGVYTHPTPDPANDVPEGTGFWYDGAGNGFIYTNAAYQTTIWKMQVHMTLLADDVGVTSIIDPQAMINPGSSVAPSVVITNWGLNPEIANIPVTVRIDSGAIPVTVYTSAPYTYLGTLAPGASSAPITLTPNWTIGSMNNTYSVRAFTSLGADLNRGNDTAFRTVISMPPPNRYFAPEWDLNTGFAGAGAGIYGVAGVQDSLIWVARGFTLPFKIVIYRASDLTPKDSFTTAYQSGSYGYRDMYWDRNDGAVYAGTDGNRLDKISASAPYGLIATYTVTGAATPGIVRALTGDGDSLYTANFSSSPILKMAKDGTNCHQVAPYQSLGGTYGLALDRTTNRMYLTNAISAPNHLIEYAFPSWTQTLDTIIPATNVDANGGCEMFHGDTFLLIVEQSNDIIHCVRVVQSQLDVGVDLVESPIGLLMPGTFSPKVRIKNYGLNPTLGFPAVLTTTGGYTSTMPVPALNPGDTAQLTFADWTPSGGGTFILRCTTQLTGDQNTRNDAGNGTALIPNFIKNFEADNGDFTVSGTAGWAWGAPAAPPARPAPHSGAKEWGAVLSGSYPVSMNTSLTSCQLLALANNPIVVFYSWFYFETSWDGGNVKYSTDGGTTWTLATPLSLGATYNGTANSSNPLYPDPIFTGGPRPTDGSMELVAVQIPATAGSSFLVRWQAGSDASVTYNGGWVIDDVAGINCRPPVKDVGVVNIVRPNAIETPGTIGVPVQIRVHNYGDIPATFDIRAIIPNANGSDTLRTGKLGQTLAAGGEAVFLMDNLWDIASVPTIYPMRCSTVLAGDNDPTNDKLLKYVLTGTTDAAVSAILTPTGNCDTWTTITPSAKLKNLGTVAYPFRVFLWFDSTGATTHSYYQGVTATIPAGDSAVTVFPAWAMPYPVQNYAVKCSVYVPSDGNLGNNVKTGSFAVIPGLLDYAVDQIVTPAGTMDTLSTILPTARIRNVGTASRLAWVHLMIDDRTDAKVYEDSATVTVPGGQTGLAVMPEWLHPHLPLWFNTKCWLTLPGDENAANDTLNDSFQVVLGTVDYGVDAIGGPTGTHYDTTEVIIPAATVHNYGTINPLVKVFFTITDNTLAVVYYDSLRITDLLPEEARPVTFSEWLPKPHPLGAYLTLCKAVCLGDPNPANDSQTGGFAFRIQPTNVAWTPSAPLLPGVKSKRVKDGAALAYVPPTPLDNRLDDTAYVYAFKGNGRYEFYRYNATTNTWISRDSIPAYNRLGKKKAVKKGSSLVFAGDSKLYGSKGNNTLDFWQYDPKKADGAHWSQMTDVPTGTKNCKEGVGAAAVTIHYPDDATDSNFVYLLKGSGTTEFYRYNVDAGSWQSMETAPTGASSKPFKVGSTIAYDGVDTIYCVKGSYNEFFAYSIANRNWATLQPVPLMIPGSTKKKKVKSGAGLAVAGRVVYALKGGNTNEFWTFKCDSQYWSHGTDLTTGTKRVNGGGALVAAPELRSLYAFRGNNTLEFWQYGPLDFSAFSRPMLKAEQGEMAAGLQRVSSYKLLVSPNPFARVASVSYSLPKADNVSLKLYDVSGALVATLAKGYVTAGSHSAVINAEKLASGIYLLKFESGNYHTTNKLIVE